MHDLCELVRVQVCEARDGARRTYEHVWKERREEKRSSLVGRLLLAISSPYVVRTTGDDRLEVDDCVSEGGAVEGLAGYFEGREEEWRGHHREVLVHVGVSNSVSMGR